MLKRGYGSVLVLVLGFIMLGDTVPRAKAQAPTIEETGLMVKPSTVTPGSMNSLLGPMPGSSGQAFGMQPGRDDMILGRIGAGRRGFPHRSRHLGACIKARDGRRE